MQHSEILAERKSEGRAADPKLPLYSNKCLCSACGKYFGGVTVFDAHRAGRTPTGRARDRSCRGFAQMDQRGFYLSVKGYWSLRHSTERKRPKQSRDLQLVPRP